MIAIPSPRRTVLLVAGSDSSGGAGIAADIRAAQSLGAIGRLAVTAVTAQTDSGVGTVHPVPPALLREQIAAAMGEGPVGAVKIGMLGSAAAVDTVASALQDAGQRCPIVLDPVLVSTSGGSLLDEAGIARLLETLLQMAALVTPNLDELTFLARRLGGDRGASLERQASTLMEAGAKALLVKGGHGGGPAAEDWLFRQGAERPARFSAPRLAASLRGTGCTLSTAIAVHLASGLDLDTACGLAKRHLTDLIAHAGQHRPAQNPTSIRR